MLQNELSSNVSETLVEESAVLLLSVGSPGLLSVNDSGVVVSSRCGI